MAMKLVEESEMKVAKGKHVANEKQEIKEDKIPIIVKKVACITDKSITILSSDKIIRCERSEGGAPSNCAICEGITKEMFDRCKHKWTGY